MMRHIWTRIAVTSLILLGDGAFASEINPRGDIEAATSGSIAQISLQTFLDDSESSGQPVPLAVYAVSPVIKPAKIIISALAHTTADTHNYHPLNPRAPPFLAR